MWWRRLAEVQTEHQNGEERGFKLLRTWNGCWCQTGWSEYFKNWWSTGIFMNHPSGAHWWWLRRDQPPPPPPWHYCKALWCTTIHNKGLYKCIIHSFNTISERTTCWTLKQMGYSSRRSHRVPLLSAKNRKRRLQFAQACQNWTRVVWENVVWSDESQFLLWQSDGRVRIWRKEHEILPSLNGSCGGFMVWGIFSWPT